MAMRLLAGVLVAVALGAVGAAAAGRPTFLRSVRTVHHHLILRLSVTDVRPTQLTLARRRAVDANGALLQKNVLLREPIRLPAAAADVVRWRSGRRLRRGVYFAQVTAVETGGVTDCPRFSPECNVRRSSVKRVVVRATR